MKSGRSARRPAWLLVVATLLAACGDSDDSTDPAPATTEVTTTAATATTGLDAGGDIGRDPATDDLFPDVVDASAEPAADGTWTFSATLSSPYDTPSRYADAWRVVGPDGTAYGVRELTHDHQNEQPFTRTLTGVVVPDGVQVVVVEGRDQINGWGGDTVEVLLAGG